MSRTDPTRSAARKLLESRFALRWHMTLILWLAALFAWLGSVLLLGLGVSSLTIRYPLVAVLGYVGFIGGVRLWLWYIASALAPARGSSDWGALGEVADVADHAGATPVAEAGEFAVAASGGSSGGGGGGGDLSVDGDAGAALLIIVVVVAAIAVVGGAVIWILVQAPLILVEAALPLLAASVLRRRSQRLDQGGWTGGVVRMTFVPFVLVVLVAAVLGVALESLCPGAATFGGVLHACVSP